MSDVLGYLEAMRQTERRIAREYFEAWLKFGKNDYYHELMSRARAAAARSAELRALWEVVAETQAGVL